MAKKRKLPELTHCKVTYTTHPSAPWRVSFPVEVDGKTVRKRRTFSTEEKAYDFATGHEKEVSDFGVRFGSITAEARRAFDFYRDARADLLGSDIDVPSFEALVMNAVANLRTEHEERLRNRVTVAEAVEKFRDYKASRVGKRHAEGLKTQFRYFALAFGTEQLNKVTGESIESWITSLRSTRAAKDGTFPLIGKTTRNKYRKNLRSLFAHGLAPVRSWCDLNPLADIESEKVERTTPKTYTPVESAKIMQAALDMDSPLLPSLALGMFSGLRPSETMAIDLSVIDMKESEFRVPDETKTGARIVPMTAACRAWLGSQPRRTGKAYQEDRREHSRHMCEVLKAAQVDGVFDGARHSFITYRCADIRDVAQVSDECGNSPSIIKKHYRKIVGAAIATKFFAIRPKRPKSKITDIKTGRKSA